MAQDKQPLYVVLVCIQVGEVGVDLKSPSNSKGMPLVIVNRPTLLRLFTWKP
jgi:hypothetical protein